MPYNPNIHNRQSIRLPGYDYSQEGAYFITICTHEMECLFGHIENDEMVLNELGKIARQELLKTQEMRPDIELDVFEVMPNHIHCIINILPRRGDLRSPSLTSPNTPSSPSPLLKMPFPGRIFTGEQQSGRPQERKTQEGRPHDGQLQEGRPQVAPTGPKSKSIGAIMAGYKSAVTKQINIIRDGPGYPVWHRNFHEHIIRDEDSYHTISEYILNNPANWAKDKFYR